MNRLWLALGASLVASVAGCGDDPAPLSGKVYWAVGCQVDMGGANCIQENFRVEPAPGPRTLMECSVGTEGSQTRINAVVAGLNEGETGFDQSSQGLSLTGLVNGVGQEMTSGYMTLRGLGWSTTPSAGALGPTQRCHVFLDAINGRSVRGRIRCEGLQDDQSPPRSRYVRGVPGPMAESATYEFNNCEPLSE